MWVIHYFKSLPSISSHSYKFEVRTGKLESQTECLGLKNLLIDM